MSAEACSLGSGKTPGVYHLYNRQEEEGGWSAGELNCWAAVRATSSPAEGRPVFDLQIVHRDVCATAAPGQAQGLPPQLRRHVRQRAVRAYTCACVCERRAGLLRDMEAGRAKSYLMRSMLKLSMPAAATAAMALCASAEE